MFNRAWMRDLAYIPFPRPVPTEPDMFAEDPFIDWHVGFDVLFLPYVLGACKVLARPETYIGANLVDIENMTRMGNWLLFRLMTPEPPPVTAPNWEVQFVTTHGTPQGYQTDVEFADIAVGTGRNYVGVWESEPVSIEPEVLVRGHDALNASLIVGGVWDMFEVRTGTPGAEKAIVVTITFCDDTTDIFSGFTPYITTGVYKSFNVVAGSAPIVIRASISGDWLCGPA